MAHHTKNDIASGKKKKGLTSVFTTEVKQKEITLSVAQGCCGLYRKSFFYSMFLNYRQYFALVYFLQRLFFTEELVAGECGASG